MKTQKRELTFSKNAIVELQSNDLMQVKGGGTTDSILKTIKQTLTDCTLSTQPHIEL